MKNGLCSTQSGDRFAAGKQIFDPAATLSDVFEFKGQFADRHAADTVETVGRGIHIGDRPSGKVGKRETIAVQDPGIPVR